MGFFLGASGLFVKVVSLQNISLSNREKNRKEKRKKFERQNVPKSAVLGFQYIFRINLQLICGRFEGRFQILHLAFQHGQLFIDFSQAIAC
jgi:hypothetical protein